VSERTLEIKNISKSFDNCLVIDNVSLDFKLGTINFFVGKNGVGKTTLMELITGLLVPDFGEIILDGKALSIPYPKSVRQSMFFLPVENIAIDYLSAQENLVYFSELFHINKDRIRDLLDEYQLEKYKNKWVKDYSKGMTQRLNLAIMDLVDSDILVLDEPSLGLDVFTLDFLRKKIIDYKNLGKLLIVTSHDMDFCKRLADNVYLFKDNIIEKCDTINNLEDIVLSSIQEIE
jgi:ABC-2 type transport system ATP-binding protein/heme exporter protein A